MKIKKSLKNRNIQRNAHARCQKREVPEEAKIGRTITRIEFFTCALGAPRSAYPRDAVSAPEPLCTFVKDYPGLGSPKRLSFYSEITCGGLGGGRGEEGQGGPRPETRDPEAFFNLFSYYYILIFFFSFFPSFLFTFL